MSNTFWLRCSGKAIVVERAFAYMKICWNLLDLSRYPRQTYNLENIEHLNLFIVSVNRCLLLILCPELLHMSFIDDFPVTRGPR